jgi:multicomponent Na+:H+ antiporter subunit B
VKISSILVCVSRLLYPFILLFGVYIILHGDTSPGGGFQGGAIIATAFILTHFIDNEKTFNTKLLLKLEKFYFIAILIIVSISFLTNGELFTNFAKHSTSLIMKRIFLLSLNLFIGLKVASGLIVIFSTFIEEGR